MNIYLDMYIYVLVYDIHIYYILCTLTSHTYNSLASHDKYSIADAATAY